MATEAIYPKWKVALFSIPVYFSLWARTRIVAALSPGISRPFFGFWDVPVNNNVFSPLASLNEISPKSHDSFLKARRLCIGAPVVEVLCILKTCKQVDVNIQRGVPPGALDARRLAWIWTSHDENADVLWLPRSQSLLSSAAAHQWIMYTIILKCMDPVLRSGLRFLFRRSNCSHQKCSGFLGGRWFTLKLCFPDAHVRKWGGNWGPEELQEAQWGRRAALSALLCETPPARSFPATLGPSWKKRHGGRWRAGPDRRSSPSSPEPVGGGGTRHVSIFYSFCGFMPPVMINLPLMPGKLLRYISPRPLLQLQSLCPSQTPTHTTNSLISHSQPPSRLRSHTCTHQPTQKALSHASRGLNGLFSRMISTLVEAACPQKSRVK